MIKYNKAVYMNKLLMKKKKLIISKIKEVAYIEQYQKMEPNGKYYLCLIKKIYTLEHILQKKLQLEYMI